MNEQPTSNPGSRDSRLFIWPKGADVTAVKSIVVGLGLDYTVKPFWFDQAISEGVKRVLVLADGFEGGAAFDYIYPRSEANLKESVEWALGLREESRGARLAIDTMKRIFGDALTMTTEEKEAHYGE